MALGKHKIEYEVLEGWDRLPEGWSYVEVAGGAARSRDPGDGFKRGGPSVQVFGKEGGRLQPLGGGGG